MKNIKNLSGEQSVLPLILAAIIICGCAEVEQRSDGTTEVRTGGVRAQVNEAGLKLPEGFPEDLPAYPGSTLTATLGGQGITMVSYQTDATVAEVTEFYRTSLPEKGWSFSGEVRTAESSLLHAAREGSRGVSIGISADARTANTVITLTLSIM